jgi:hypothetical protein
MALEVWGNVIPSSNRSAKRSNSGCDVKGSDGVHGIRVSSVPNRTGHANRHVDSHGWSFPLAFTQSGPDSRYVYQFSCCDLALLGFRQPVVKRKSPCDQGRQGAQNTFGQPRVWKPTCYTDWVFPWFTSACGGAEIYLDTPCGGNYALIQDVFLFGTLAPTNPRLVCYTSSCCR